MLHSAHFEHPRQLVAVDPEITAKPTPDGVDLLLGRRDDLVCATSCINSAVTKSTTCTVGDLLCECRAPNALSIWLGASNCILVGCGASVWLVASRIASHDCVTAIGGQYTAPTITAPPIQTTPLATNVDGGGSNGSPTTNTAPIPGGASAGASSGTSSAGSPSSPPSSASLSTGAIVGIAIGGVAGGILLCAALFLVFRWGRRSGRKSRDEDTAGTDNQTPPEAGGDAAAVSAADAKPELDGAKPGAPPASTSPSHTQSVNSTPSGPLSPLTPQSPPPVYPGWQQQQHYGQLSPQQQVHEIPGVTAYPAPAAQEMHATALRQEMGSSHLRHEMPTHGYGAGVYEMPAGPRSQ